MKKILFEDALILRLIKAARFLAGVLPLSVSFFIARGVGTAGYYLSKRRKIAYKNLRAAFASEKSPAELRRIAKEAIQNLAMSVVELLRIPEMDEAYIRRHLEFQGAEKFQNDLQKGKGIIFLAAHFGNWELLNITGGLLGYQIVALARVQKHPRSDEFLNSLRASKGSQVIHKGMPIREIVRALRGGKIVGILSDQDGGRNGVFVRFFGRMSSSPSGVAAFGLRTGAPIYPIFIFRTEKAHHRVEVEGPLKMPDPSLSEGEAERMILQEFADILESKIRRAPNQWLWAHRRWKSTLDRFVVVLHDGKAGHLNQSLAVLDAIKTERESLRVSGGRVRSKIIQARYQSRLRKNLLQFIAFISGGRIPLKRFLLRFVLESSSHEEIIRAYADIVISCGASLLALNLCVKEENQAKSIVVMKPFFGLDSFDAIVAPRHDRLSKRSNLFVTERSLSRVNLEVLKQEGERLSREIGSLGGGKRIGFLVGGDTEGFRFDPDVFQKIVRELLRFSADSGSQVLATSSRRTPAWADEVLRENLSRSGRCPLLVIANEANREGVVNGILGLCDVALVSGESISMVSEAVSSGKPVAVFMPGNGRAAKPKHRKFLERLRKARLIFPVSPENLYEWMAHRRESPNGNERSFLLKDEEVLRQAVRRVL